MLSDDAKAFIASAIASIWALEVLLLLRKNSDRACTVEDLTRELRATESIVREALGVFATAGVALVEEDGAARYAPATPGIADVVTEIAAAYAAQPVALAREILSGRNAKIRHFSDAFRFRKD